MSFEVIDPKKDNISETDVCIVGNGYAGMNLARLLIPRLVFMSCMYKGLAMEYTK